MKKIHNTLKKNNVRHWNHKAIKRGRVKLRKMGKEKISKYLLNEIWKGDGGAMRYKDKTKANFEIPDKQADIIHTQWDIWGRETIKPHMEQGSHHAR